MKRYLSMMGNYLLYLAVIILVIFLYNTVIDPVLGWGQFGKGTNIPIQVFMVLVITIALSAIVYTIKYRLLKQTPGSFWRLCGFSPISPSFSVHMITIGLAFTLLNAATMKLLLYYNITTFNEFTEEYYNSVPFPYLIVSSVLTTSLELILFIGIMFNEARKHVPVFWPILVIALIIAALQPGGIAMQLLGVVLGFIYGYVYARFSSIWSAMLIGIVFNISLFGMKKIGWLDSMENMSEFTLIVLAAVMGLYLIFSTLFYWRKPKAR
ncbi:type II CAAX prenyl endopeptidase Rce1 family protein [Paenibacillus sp. MBLB4367]|uniref:CPBP family glutamic-type intramembrane protease n=1 Tax=Paenibacillus sp. MBLB4367 TaxID=3384767 RepID=UPI00390810D1